MYLINDNKNTGIMLFIGAAIFPAFDLVSWLCIKFCNTGAGQRLCTTTTYTLFHEKK